MKGRTLFRSVDEWKSALMLLPENNFFELLRSIFGNIKTPFNKQRLLDELFALLSRSETKKTIAAYIDAQDHKLIAAVALLNEPVAADLESFFAGELSATELHAILVNLEERLILYRFRHEGLLRLALNPVLEPILSPLISDTQILFPSFPTGSALPAGSAVSTGNSVSAGLQAASVWVNDTRGLAALFAFFLDEEDLFKSDIGLPFQGAASLETAYRGIRKKVLVDGKKIFPGLDLELIIRVFLVLSIFRIEGRSLIPCRERLEAFLVLNSLERQKYWAAGVYLCLKEVLAQNDSSFGAGSDDLLQSSGMFSQNRLYGNASLIHQIMNNIVPERYYPEITLKRLLEFTEKDNIKAGYSWPPVMSGRSEHPFSFELLLTAMEKTGLLEKAGIPRRDSEEPGLPSGVRWKAGPITCPHSGDDTENSDSSSAPKPVIVMDTAFSFILYPEISFTDAFALGAFCSVKNSNESSVSFELTRRSVVRGFDQGIDSQEMLKILDRLSGGRLDANLGWTLKEWENRYAGVSLNKGIVLTLSEEQRYLADAGPVSMLIRRTLAPGVYLLSSEERFEAAAVLRKAGLDIIAQPPLPFGSGSGQSGFYRKSSRYSFPRLGGFSFSQKGNTIQEKTNEAFSESLENKAEESKKPSSIQENFRRVLDKMKLTKPERDELLARIERRLVLSEAQLEASSVRYEKLEARGLDYAGKAAIAKQAVDSGHLIEIFWPVAGGGQSNAVGIAEGLEKKDGDSILVIKPRDLEESIRVPLRKISLLRRIKQSIFGE